MTSKKKFGIFWWIYQFFHKVLEEKLYKVPNLFQNFFNLTDFNEHYINTNILYNIKKNYNIMISSVYVEWSTEKDNLLPKIKQRQDF